MGYNASLHTYPSQNPSGLVSWILWIEQDGESHGDCRFWAGRVKLQDDPIATTYAIFNDALKKLEPSLRDVATEPLF